MKTDRFGDLATFRAEKDRLRTARDHHAGRLRAHFDALGESEVRSTLMKNTVGGLFSGTLPGKLLSKAIGNGGIGSGIGMAVGLGKGGILKRLGMFVLGMAAPKLIHKVEEFSIEDLRHELLVSWERWKDHSEQRRRSKAAH